MIMDCLIMAKDTNRTSKAKAKILQVIIYVLLGVIIFALCITSILKYNEWPVYTETNVVSQNEVRFPVMTFCPLKNGYKESSTVTVRAMHSYAPELTRSHLVILRQEILQFGMTDFFSL